jgi:WD40 repeat protein
MLQEMKTSEPVTSLLVHGRNLVVGCEYAEDSVVQIWDMSHLELNESVREYTKIKNCFAAQGKLLISNISEVQIIDLVTQSVAKMEAHSQSVRHVVSYKSDIISCGGELIRWDATTLKVKNKISIDHIDVGIMEVFEDQLLIAGWDGLCALDLATGSFHTITECMVMAMSIDQKLKVVVFYASQVLEVLDLKSEKVTCTLPLDQGLSCLKCYEGKLIIGPLAPVVQVWDLERHTLIGTLHGHTRKIVQLDAFGGQVATNDGYCVRIWDLDSFRCICAMEVGRTEPIKSIALSAQWLATVSKSTGLKWWRMDEITGEMCLMGVKSGGWALTTMHACNVEGVTGMKKNQKVRLREGGMEQKGIK